MKGYLVLDFSIKVLESFLEYAEKIPTFIEKHGGRYIVKGVVPEKMEGNWIPERLVILEFPSTEKAKEFLADPEAQDLFEIRHKTTNSQLILAEGCI
ncbi:DUF1330 domain-containing protein [Microbulbifer variabilis]|uniref:DUF1330 domain-containing protein n=1 Tax=Microbulbifer variabilis TaxID=266805 RepID=A0ABY4VBQ2_9GAMM|nr:DUF1330 domain-containing protein [Microbulbifer variabilis]USD21703.1 DUF1330 domain-containing protein [Microbulbifer variabilis]